MNQQKFHSSLLDDVPSWKIPPLFQKKRENYWQEQISNRWSKDIHFSYPSLFGSRVHADIMKMAASTTHGCSLQCLVMCCPVMQTLKIRSIYSWACNVYPQNMCKFKGFLTAFCTSEGRGEFSRWCNPKRHVKCKNEDPLQKSVVPVEASKKKTCKIQKCNFTQVKWEARDQNSIWCPKTVASVTLRSEY